MKSKIFLFITILGLSLFSCSEDFLDRPPVDQVTIDNYYQTPEELRIATNALYNNVWFSYNDKAYFAIGDVASGNMLSNDGGWTAFARFAVTGTTPRLLEAWRSHYGAIAQANMVIFSVNNSDSPDITAEDKNLAIAEARFMRGVAYLLLAECWGDVPIIENNLNLLDDYEIPKNNVEDVYDFAIRDLEFAAENLLLTDQPGKVTQWSAKGMLARAHLYRAGLGQNGSRDAQHLQKAKDYAVDVIENSDRELQDDYGSLFTLEGNNNPETLFALQWVDKGSGWGVQNTHQAYFAPEGKVTGTGDGWGGANGATYDIQQLYEAEDERRKETFMYKGDFYPELVQEEGGYLYDSEGYAGSAIKKYVIGRPDDNPGYTLSFMSTPLNTYMLRLAEVYLIAAEAILADDVSTSDADALRYFNAVRERAGLDPYTSITFDDIFREKRLELAMEGRFWGELVRWHYFEPDEAKSYIANQNRGRFEWEEGEKHVVDEFYTPEDEDFRFPYPETDIANNPLLSEDPVPYDFSE